VLSPRLLSHTFLCLYRHLPFLSNTLYRWFNKEFVNFSVCNPCQSSFDHVSNCKYLVSFSA
jgi:hypothetical protein